MKTWLWTALVPLLLACAGSPDDPAAAAADEAPQRADPMLAEMGAETFESYCASCHGMDARGNGPAAENLQTPPADLRRIAVRRGGDFPDAEIAMKIDGRFEIGAHGSREMPVWGTAFGSDIPDSDTAESVTRGKLLMLIEYLKSIQDETNGGDPEATRRTMGQIFDAMQLLLPLSLDAEAFEDPARSDEIGAALALLDESASTLGQHGGGSDVSFAHLSRSLSIDARDVRLRYEQGHRRESRYLVQTLTETCVACHSRLPSGPAPRSDAFARDIEQKGLSLEQRAKLAYATRQFDVAAEQYVALLQSKDVSANDIDLAGYLDDYLELEVRVRRDLERPAESLTQFRKRSDLSPALRGDVAYWLASLDALAARAPSGDPVADANTLIIGTEGALRGEDRKQLVRLLEASGVLHRALSAGGLPNDQRAEAYFLLGVIETRIGRSYWLSQAEAYLETAIRLAPGTPLARDAYDLLDEFLVAGYSGSGGTHVPPDIRAKLDTLSRLADGA